MNRGLALVAAAGAWAGLIACAPSSDGSAQPGAASDDVKTTKVLLDCNVFESGGGPDQQVKVEETKDGLVLRELTNHQPGQ